MHLLTTQIAKLDEADAAIDLEQSPADVVVLSFADSDLSALAAAWKMDADILPTLRLASLKKLKHPMSVDLYAEAVVANARAVIVRCLGGFDYWRYGLEIIGAVACKNSILFAALPGDDRPDPRLAEISTMTAEMLSRLNGFFREGGPESRQRRRELWSVWGGHLIAATCIAVALRVGFPVPANAAPGEGNAEEWLGAVPSSRR